MVEAMGALLVPEVGQSDGMVGLMQGTASEELSHRRKSERREILEAGPGRGVRDEEIVGGDNLARGGRLPIPPSNASDEGGVLYPDLPHRAPQRMPLRMLEVQGGDVEQSNQERLQLGLGSGLGWLGPGLGLEMGLEMAMAMEMEWG